MNELINNRGFFRENFVLILGICLCVYFTYHTVQGERSLTHLVQLNQSISVEAHVHDLLEHERVALETKVKMMRPGSIDADLLEEQVRLVLGYKHPDELIVLR